VTGGASDRSGAAATDPQIRRSPGRHQDTPLSKEGSLPSGLWSTLEMQLKGDARWNCEGDPCKRAGYPTLSTAISRISTDEALDRKERIYRCCGLRTFARCLGLAPELIPISAQYFRSQVRLLTPARTKLSASRLATIKSQLGFVLKYVHGGEGVRPRGRKIGKNFAQLLSFIGDKWDRIALMRFFSFCTRERVKPNEVNNNLIRCYCEYLVNASLVANPARNALMVQNIWNYCAKTYPAWPRVRLSMTGRSRSPLKLREALKQDVERYKKFLAGLERHPVTSEFILRPLVQSSILQHVRALYRCAAAAHIEGLRPESISDLLRADILIAIQKNIRSTERQLSPAYTHRHMLELVLAAKRWTFGAPALGRRQPYLAADARVRSSTTKFRQIFELLETDSLARLLDLPTKLMALALGYDVSHPKRRGIAQAALGIEIMLMVPLSPAQLLDLRIGVSIIEDPNSKNLILSTHSAKEPQRELRYQLPERSARLLQTYRSALLTDVQEGVWLFPSKYGSHRQPAAFGETVSRQILKHVGVQVTPRALRFLGSTLYLRRYPDRYETVRQAMGHKALAHTRRTFGFVHTVQSAKQFDAVLRNAADCEDQ
jgi:integrase